MALSGDGRLNTRDRFRIARRTVRRMVRACRMENPGAARAEYFQAIFELDGARARPLFRAALRCHSASRPDA